MVFDFRHKNTDGKWKWQGHWKGTTRDAAFDAFEQKKGGMPEGRYMSRPRDGHAKDWDLFNWPRVITPPSPEPTHERSATGDASSRELS